MYLPSAKIICNIDIIYRIYLIYKYFKPVYSDNGASPTDMKG